MSQETLMTIIIVVGVVASCIIAVISPPDKKDEPATGREAKPEKQAPLDPGCAAIIRLLKSDPGGWIWDTKHDDIYHPGTGLGVKIFEFADGPHVTLYSGGLPKSVGGRPYWVMGTDYERYRNRLTKDDRSSVFDAVKDVFPDIVHKASDIAWTVHEWEEKQHASCQTA